MLIDNNTFDMPRFLAKSPLFCVLSEEELCRLARGCQINYFAKGDLVFRIGEPCEAFHIVVTGQIKLFVVSATGQEKVIEILSPGQSFAEALMFLEKPYILSAQTLTDGIVVSVSKSVMFNEVLRDPRFSMHLLAGMSRRLHGLVQDVEGYALRSGMQRLIGYLLRDVESAADPSANTCTVSLPASKATIASRLSLTPEYFSRVLHELESRRLIEIDKREIRILDLSALAACACN
jgi:CRP-like cAMP-binding protein